VLNLRYPQSKNNSQCGKIYALILSRYPERVPIYEIFPLAQQYDARIWTLRRWLWPEGFDISCEEEWVDGQCHSWYRLIVSPTSAAPPLTPEPEIPWERRERVATDLEGRPLSPADAGPLFGRARQ
jgi:hypothetical protein